MRRLLDVAPLLVTSVIGMLVSAPLSRAAVTNTFTDRASFAAAAGPTVTETFNSFAAETPFYATSLDVGAFTLSMNGNPATDRNFIDLQPLLFDVFNVDGTAVADVLTVADESLFLTFDSPITAFGADLAAFNDDVLRTQIIVAGEVLTPAVTSDNQVRFFGFQTDTPFSTVEFRGVTNDGYGMDNVTFTPEPGAAVLVVGVLLCGAAVRRTSVR